MRPGDGVRLRRDPVEIEPGPSFRSGTPKLLFNARDGGPGADYDVAADAKRFLLARFRAEQEAGPPQAHFVFEWFEEIQRRVRVGG